LADLGIIPAGAVNLLPNTNVSRTGYNEVDLTNNKASNTKMDFSLHFRPLGNEKLEVIWQSKFGFGNAVYQGANRYYLNDFFMQQHKLEIQGKNFFIRGYTTNEDGGKSYDMLFTGINVNRAWKDDKTWFGQYAGAYIQSTLAGMSPENAHIAARNVAEIGRLVPGTAAFKSAFNTVINEPSVLNGSKLVDNSSIYHSDANYNFKDIIKFAEFQAGGSYRKYNLNSHGRIYTDMNDPITYDEWGTYLQMQKKMMDERLKLTASLRYDKSQNFDGNYSPRLSMVYSAGDNKQHNLRASFQTGFRNPSTQDQYIGFNVGSAVLLGSAPDNLLRYSEALPVSTTTGQFFNGGDTKVMNGENAYYNSYTASSVRSFSALAGTDPVAAAKLLKRTNVGLVKPEEVKAFELGYRSQIKSYNIDLNGYYNIYNNFIGNLNVAAPLYGTAQDAPNIAGGPADLGFQSIHALTTGNYRAYQLYTNTNLQIESLGVGIGVSRKLFGNYDFGVSYNYAEFKFDQAKDPSFEAGFNTPKHKVKFSVGNDKLVKNFGFNVSARWNSEYLWQSSFADGMIASATVVDAQANYGIPKLRSLLKIGATNIAGKEYTQVLGAGSIGQQYFISWTINP